VIVRVIVGRDVRKVADAIRKALDDPEVDSVVVHKPGSHVRMADGRELVFDGAGRLVAAREERDACV
jgi:hypothetical protein